MTEIRNPFADPLRFERRVPECAIVIFGAAGDLARRKLLPALYRLAYDRRLPASFAIVGTSRTPLSDDEYRQRMLDAVWSSAKTAKWTPICGSVSPPICTTSRAT